MQLHIDLTNQPEAYGKRIIAMIEAFYGLPHTSAFDTTPVWQGLATAVASGPISPDAEINGLTSKAAAWDAVCGQLNKTLPAWPDLGASGIDAACAAIRGLAMPAASVPSVSGPLPDIGTFGKIGPESPLYAPSTVAAVPSPTAPVVAQVSSPEQVSASQMPAVPTAPAATAPTAPAAPTTHASGVAIDKAGLPWDARIHSSSKAINANGTWRKRNGLNDEGLVKRIEAELMAAMAVPATPVVTPAPEVAAVPAPLPVAPIAPATEMPAFPSAPSVAPTLPPAMPAIPAPLPVPVAAPTALPSVPAAAIPTAPPTTLPELMPRITGAMMTGTLPGTALLDAVKSNGIPDLPTLAHRPDLIPQVWATLQATYPGVLV